MHNLINKWYIEPYRLNKLDAIYSYLHLVESKYLLNIKKIFDNNISISIRKIIAFFSWNFILSKKLKILNI